MHCFGIWMHVQFSPQPSYRELLRDRKTGGRHYILKRSVEHWYPLNTHFLDRIVAGDRYIRLSFFENVSAGMCWRMR